MIKFLNSNAASDYKVANTYPEPTIEWKEYDSDEIHTVVHTKTIMEFLSDLGKSN